MNSSSFIKPFLGVIAGVAPPALVATLTDLSWTNPLFIIGTIIFEIFVLASTIFRKVLSQLTDLWIKRLTPTADASLQRLWSNYRRRIRAHTKATNSYLDRKGLITLGEQALAIEDVFVNLALDPTAVHALQSDPLRYGVEGGDGATTGGVWFWLRRARTDNLPLVIVGPPGSGKTTLLRHVSHTLVSSRRQARRHKFKGIVPIFVTLRDHRDRFNLSDPTLPEIIRAELDDVDGEPPEWIEKQLTRGRLLILLDGLDEVATAENRELLVRWVDRQRTRYSRTQFVMTSRPFGYKNNPLSEAVVLQVQRFSVRQIETFVHHWYVATLATTYPKSPRTARLMVKEESDKLLRRLRESSEFEDLAANPLLLTMIISVHHYRGALPGSRTELYNEVCQVFLGNRLQARGVPIDMSAAQKQEILQYLAYGMMRSRVRDVSIKDAAGIVASHLRRIAPHLDTQEFLVSVEGSSGLLIEGERGLYSFCHLTFQEYLAAVHLNSKRHLKRANIDVHDEWWHEVLRLYAAQADATPIVEKCLEAADSDPTVLALAVDCMKDAFDLDPGLRERVNKLADPPSIRTDKAARRTAATVQFLLRLRGFTRINEDVFLSVNPITAVEYQLFLDEWPKSQLFVPDHWSEDVFPAGSASLPVLGLRSVAALAFEQWFSSRADDTYEYRLPFTSELGSADVRRLLSENAGGVVKAALVRRDEVMHSVTDDTRICEAIILDLPDSETQLSSIRQRLSEDVDAIQNDFDLQMEWALPYISIQLIQGDVPIDGKELEIRKLYVTEPDFEEWVEVLAAAAAPSFVDAALRVAHIDIDELSATIDYSLRKYRDALESLGSRRSEMVQDRSYRQSADGEEGISDPDRSDTVERLTLRWFGVLLGSVRMSARRDAIAGLSDRDRAWLRTTARTSALILAYLTDRFPVVAEGKGRGRHKRKVGSSQRVQGQVVQCEISQFWLDIYANLAIFEGRVRGETQPMDGIYMLRLSAAASASRRRRTSIE